MCRYRDKLKEVVDRIVRVYEIAQPISDVKKLVKKLGGMFECEISIGNSELVLTGNPIFTIKLPMSVYDVENKLTYCVVYELSHLFLYTNYIERVSLTDISSSDLVRLMMDTYSNEKILKDFMYELLMPEEKFKSIVEENTVDGRVAMKKVASFFNVPLDHAINRASFLRLVSVW